MRLRDIVLDVSLTWDQVCAIALRYPEVTRSVSYGEPSLKFRKHLLTRLREADNSLVVLDVPPPEREMLIEAAPDVFFCEPHYAPHDIVLARLAALTADAAAPLLDRRWRNLAPKRLIAAFDA